jgi:hypothetical protein
MRVVVPGSQILKALADDESFSQIQNLVGDAIRAKFQPQVPNNSGGPSSYLYIRDLYQDYAIFDQEGHMYRVDYTIDESGGVLQVLVGEKEEVEIDYTPLSEDTDDTTEEIPTELAMRFGKLAAKVNLFANRK